MPTTTRNSDFCPELIDQLSIAKNVVALTGSGISAESGVPTFRGSQKGLWARYDPQELATVEAFKRNPKLVWQWYEWRRRIISKAKPNPAHTALLELEQVVDQFILITQNIDGLHQQAGSKSVVELHGNIFRTKCFEDGQVIDDWDDVEHVPPHCPYCNGLLRPDVVWFGESLPQAALTKALTASQTCDFFFSIGTSSLVQPAASLAGYARRNGAIIVEINLAPTPLTPFVDFVLNSPAGQIMPLLINSAFPQ